MVFREGILVFSQPGALPPPALDQLIAAVRDLDMDDVRRQVAAQQPVRRASARRRAGLSPWTPPPGTSGTPPPSWCGRPDPNQFVESELADLPPGRALDLACGEGRNARWLAERGWQVTAIDFSSVAVDKGRAAVARRRRLAGRRRPDGDSCPSGLDLVVIAYLQLPADERRPRDAPRVRGAPRRRHAFVVAHDSTNLTEGTGGPQDPAVLYTAEDVLGDLAGDAPRGGPGRARRARGRGRRRRTASEGTAWDALVHVRPGG